MRDVSRPCLAAFLVTLGCWAAQAGDGPKGKVKLSAEEEKVLALVNAARQEQKLRPLKVNPILAAVARKHAANMARQGKLEHVLDGKNPGQRLKAAGYAYRGWAENIYSGARGQGEAAAREAMKWWLNSTGHRGNILDKAFVETGIGFARDDRGTFYFTQVFGAPAR